MWRFDIAKTVLKCHMLLHLCVASMDGIGEVIFQPFLLMGRRLSSTRLNYSVPVSYRRWRFVICHHTVQHRMQWRTSFDIYGISPEPNYWLLLFWEVLLIRPSSPLRSTMLCMYITACQMRHSRVALVHSNMKPVVNLTTTSFLLVVQAMLTFQPRHGELASCGMNRWLGPKMFCISVRRQHFHLTIGV